MAKDVLPIAHSRAPMLSNHHVVDNIMPHLWYYVDNVYGIIFSGYHYPRPRYCFFHCLLPASRYFL
jgi:hypothetical protein